MKEQPVASAARRQSQAILGDMLWPLHKQALRSVVRKEGASVIDISCGSGASSIGLLALLGESSRLSAFDPDLVNIDSATSNGRNIVTGAEVNFVHGQFEEWVFPHKVDCVYGAAILNTLERNTQIIEKAFDCLIPGGLLLLSFIDFSRMYGFPRSFALDRYGEYMRSFQESLGMQISPARIQSLCEDKRFSQVSLSSSMPHFLDEKSRKLPSLILEFASHFIVENGHSSTVELDAIISELRQTAEKPGAMISEPVIYQLTAVRAQ